jgi:dihydrofolate reductase
VGGRRESVGLVGRRPAVHVPVFVVTHHSREPLVLQGGTTFTFVTDGVEPAVERARAAAGDGDVLVAGGGSGIEQALRAGLLDTLQLHVVPLLLGDGVRLFDARGDEAVAFEPDRAIGSPTVTHLRYRVRR